MIDPFSLMISGRSRRIENNKLRGIVVNNKDPEKRGRMQVRYRDIHEGIPDEDLPWSAPKGGFGSGAKGVGEVDIPPNGTTVFGSHKDNSLYHPEWVRGPATDDKKIDELNGDDYPFIRGKVDDQGNYKFHDTKDGKNTVGYTHQSGTGNSTDKDGNHIINGAGKVTINGAKEIQLIGKEPVNIESESAVNIRAPKVNINDKANGKASKVEARKKPELPNTGGQTDY